MAKAPAKPEDIFEEYKKDVQELYGEDLIALILYGSAARGEYIPGKSDINFLIVLSVNGIERFHAAQPLVQKWIKRQVSIPLFLTEDYIRRSLDAFPIEFYNLSSHYTVLAGKNVFDGISINTNDLRLQVERELKGKLLNLRQAYFQGVESPKSATLLIQRSMATFLSLFPAILSMRNQPVSADSRELLNTIALAFQLDGPLLQRLYRIKIGQESVKKGEPDGLLQQYIAQIRSLALQADAWS